MFDFLLDFSITAVVITAAFASLDRMRTSLNALTARNHDSRPMENCTSILIICLSHLAYKQCQQTPYMQRRCAIEQIMYICLALSSVMTTFPNQGHLLPYLILFLVSISFLYLVFRISLTVSISISLD